jgi:hypothetical protein
VLRFGPSPEDARIAAILLHGRGASAEDILGLARQFTARPGIRIRSSPRCHRTNRGWDRRCASSPVSDPVRHVDRYLHALHDVSKKP